MGRRQQDATWVNSLMQTLQGHSVLIGGDFNAWHTTWGYPRNNSRGTQLLVAMRHTRLELLNVPEVPTRIAAFASQRDTTPDLTWASPNLRGIWQTRPDTLGSDHLPIWITLQALQAIPENDRPFRKMGYISYHPK
ncbi:hypothetical protein HPB48_012046 [Haemaphysalis longicornis]|uniref:Endonuclease/exonuclease/phosphatase domain-containing protein n=1 Tax=Haemaphysalis longicornis TaxID=44386 RepID=A0A9J6GCT9_HAELO|nr:hypothetical protein HPB48_012046 [Haemaphysalis longicornis]